MEKAISWKPTGGESDILQRKITFNDNISRDVLHIIKPTLNSIKKEIKKDINNYIEKQWENKLKKTNISSDPKDWHNIKTILGMEKEKIE